MSQPLLYDLYNEIRTDRQLISPGLEEYYLLFELMQSGQYQVKTFDEMIFCLETIWLKSEHHKERFRSLFERRREPILAFATFLKTLVKVEHEPVVIPVDPAPTPDPVKPDPDIKPPVDVPPGGEEGEKKRAPPVIKEEPAGESGNTGFSLGNKAAGSSGVLKFDQQSREIPLIKIPYLFTNDYFPVKNRQLQQAWRTLKNRKEGSDSAEMSISKTIDHTAKQGYFSSFLYEKNVVNQLQLFIFLDQSESMIAMEDFGKELCNTAREGELHTELEPRYFFKIPRFDEKKNDYILANEDGTRTIGLRKLFFKLNRKDIVVLIYSDAGALKNEQNDSRVEQTIRFIRNLYQQTGYIAWINPASKIRWEGTNAEQINKEVPMFETTRKDIESAIAALKGKLTVKN